MFAEMGHVVAVGEAVGMMLLAGMMVVVAEVGFGFG